MIRKRRCLHDFLSAGSVGNKGWEGSGRLTCREPNRREWSKKGEAPVGRKCEKKGEVGSPQSSFKVKPSGLRSLG